jgi:hypothetical protein
MIDAGYKTRADNLWSYVSGISHEVKMRTGTALWDIDKDLATTKAAIFLFHFMFLADDTENEGCGISKEECDKYLKNICSNGLFKKGKFYLSDWSDPKIGWMNFLLDILVVKGDLFRSN